MNNLNRWYFAGLPVSGAKYIALGRRNWYSAFANNLTRQLGTKVYLCDYMDWVAEADPEESLFYFIRTAERIDVHLKGIPKEDLHRATVGAGRRMWNRLELRLPHMTGWEMNQIFHCGHLEKTYWHISDSMTAEEAFAAMGRKVPHDRILAGRFDADRSLGARPMLPEEILGHYRQAGIGQLERLVRRILTRTWAHYLELFESYGTLLVSIHGNKTRRHTGMLEISVHHENLFIVQVYDSAGGVKFWDRNVDTQRLGRIMIELIKQA